MVCRKKVLTPAFSVRSRIATFDRSAKRRLLNERIRGWQRLDFGTAIKLRAAISGQRTIVFIDESEILSEAASLRTQ